MRYLRLAAIGLALACAACSSSSKDAEAPAPAAPAPQDTAPGDAVQRFYDRLNVADYGGAWELYHAEARSSLEQVGVSGTGSGLSDWATQETKRGSIAGVTIVNSSVAGTSATVRFEVRYRDGSSKRGTVDLRQEDGRWKLGLVS
jgi:hypothetical protein